MSDVDPAAAWRERLRATHGACASQSPAAYSDGMRSAMLAYAQKSVTERVAEAVRLVTQGAGPARARRIVPPYRRGALRRTKTVAREKCFRAGRAHALAAASWAVFGAALTKGKDT